MDQYTALMIDLKSSRGYTQEDRYEIQSYILAICDTLNRLFSPSLERAVAFSAGDELQGLFCQAEGAYHYVRLFRMLLHPVKIRAGIGVGSWDVQIDGEGSTAQDGQAYHRARGAIVRAGNLDDTPVVFSSGSVQDHFINFAVEMESVLTQCYTLRQNELLLLTELLYPVATPGTVALAQLGELSDVMRQRGQYAYYQRMHSRPLFQTIEEKLTVIEPANLKIDDATPGRRRGMPTAVSTCCGISRQSVEKTMKTANIFASRYAALTALRLMQDLREEREC